MTISELRRALSRPLRATGPSFLLRVLKAAIPEDAARRRVTLIACAITLLYLILIPNFLIERSKERDLRAAKAKNVEMVRLSGEYATLKRHVDAVEKRVSLSKTAGAIQVIDEIVSGLGLKSKLKGIKGLGVREVRDGMTEEGVEVTFEKLSMNELVNLLFRFDTAPYMLSSKTVAIRRSFENPNAVDLNLMVALYTKKASR